MYNLISKQAIIGKNSTIEYGAVISDHVVIGDNCFIGYHTVIRPGVIIGDDAEVRSLCFVAEDAKIGAGSKVIQFTNICKGCVLEEDVFFGIGVKTFDTKKIAHQRAYKPYGQPPYIERGSRIGSGSLIYPSVIVAHNTMVYAGSYITKSTDPYGIYRGQPAVKMGEVRSDERI